MSQDHPIDDPEILAFIAEVEGLPQPSGLTGIAAERAAYDAMCAHFRTPRPHGIAVSEMRIDGPGGPIPCRSYSPAEPGTARIVFFHGGGYCLGGLESHDDLCADLADATGLAVTAADYRLAPEHPHPAAFLDCRAAAEHAIASGPVILTGDSAGGGLAASAALSMRGRSGLLGQVLIYPELGGSAWGLASYTACAEAPLLAAADLAGYAARRAPDGVSSGDASFSVLAETDLEGAPPALISAAGVDPLRDDGVEYTRRLLGAGVQAHCRVEPQLPHMWLRARRRSRRAERAFAEICAGIRALATN